MLNPAFSEETLQLVMTGSDRAIVILNDERLVLKAGEKNHPRIWLKEANSERAIVLLDSKPLVLDLSAIAAPILKEDDETVSDQADDTGNNSNYSRSVTLWAEPNGFFYADGKINRKPVRFLVDTGATAVTFSSVVADRLGIKYKKGELGYASTASGVTVTRNIMLDKVSVGGISIRNVAASIVPGQFPSDPLLGGSFLNKLNMTRSGKKMELRKR